MRSVPPIDLRPTSFGPISTARRFCPAARTAATEPLELDPGILPPPPVPAGRATGRGWGAGPAASVREGAASDREGAASDREGAASVREGAASVRKGAASVRGGPC